MTYFQRLLARFQNRRSSRRLGSVYIYVFRQAINAVIEQDEALWEYYHDALEILFIKHGRLWEDYKNLCQRKP